MKNLKKGLAILLVATMTLFVLTGCGSKETSKDAKLIKEGTLTVGLDNTYPPMDYVDENGETIGYDIDMAKAIAKELGLKVKFVNVAWDGIFAGLDSDKYDVIISAVSVTKEREETLSLSNPYLANQQVIISAKDGKQIKSVKEMDGKKVGVQLGTTADSACGYYQENGSKLNLQQFDGMDEAFLALSGGSVDCVVTDLVVGDFYINKHGDKYTKTCDELTNEPIAVAAKKDNKALIDEINVAIDKLIKDGTTSDISKKFFGEDLTKNINTNLKNYDE